MPRPTSRPKAPVSVALTDLRESLGLTMAQLAQRMKLSLQSIARYESSRPPTKGMLRRLHTLAARQGHAKAAAVFAAAIQAEADHLAIRQRQGEIADYPNLGEAGLVLEELWNAVGESLDPIHDQAMREPLLKLADLLLIGGRKELLGEDK